MENMKNPTERRDSETEPTLPCLFTYVSQCFFFFFEIPIKISCVLMLLLISTSIILPVSFTQWTPGLHLFWLLFFFLVVFMWVFGELVSIFSYFPHQLSLTHCRLKFPLKYFNQPLSHLPSLTANWQKIRWKRAWLEIKQRERLAITVMGKRGK